MHYDTRSGYCPTLKQNYSISVEQIDITTLSDTSRRYMDGRFDCEYAEMHECSFTRKCPVACLKD